MRQDELPKELTSNPEVMFGYQLRLLIEDLRLKTNDWVAMVMEEGHREAITKVASHYGFSTAFEPVPDIRQSTNGRVLVKCDRDTSLRFF